MNRDAPLPADFRADAERSLLGLGARIELLGIALVVGYAIYLAPALKDLVFAWALAVQTSALGECRMPSEFEMLHIVVANRGNQHALIDCMYVGTPGTYRR